ncbi:hypothetical protein B0H66DRAFT_605313 [Apodospora peruviana]|uniref:Uncharacterized protein n=1 Tax=Apodospora peruviana TaxID=516989 RepID=A0AAE0I2N1_9PEZI|nr:hypothetical protein B0H66DRAFT_605313 [Apodospora peruviana]
MFGSRRKANRNSGTGQFAQRGEQTPADAEKALSGAVAATKDTNWLSSGAVYDGSKDSGGRPYGASPSPTAPSTIPGREGSRNDRDQRGGPPEHYRERKAVPYRSDMLERIDDSDLDHGPPLPIRRAITGGGREASSPAKDREVSHGTTSPPAKPEHAKMLDDLMERYERKEEEARKKHQAELRQNENEKARMQAKFEDTLNQYQAQLAALQANHANQLQKERHDREQHISLLAADYQDRGKASEEKALAQCRGLEEDLKRLQEHYEDKLRKQNESNEATIKTLRTERANMAGHLNNQLDMTQRVKQEQINALRKELSLKATEIENHKAQKDGLISEMADMQKENRILRDEVVVSRKDQESMRYDLERKLKGQMENAEKLETKWKHEMQQLKDRHAQEVQNLRMQTDRQRHQYEGQLMEKDRKFVENLEGYQSDFRKEADRLAAQHHRNTVHLKERIVSLEGSLVDNIDDLRPSFGGDSLKIKFRNLKLKVETITEPFNLNLVSSGGSVEELDPTGFLAREGKNQMRFFLRSLCWSTIIEGFFSAPFGFGAFGRGEGRQLLINLYCTWQRLFDPAFTGFISAPELKDQEDFEPFYRDKFANLWRSATFQSIMTAVQPTKGSKVSKRTSDAPNREEPPTNEAAVGIAKVFVQNVERVRSDLLGMLKRACGGSSVSGEIEGIVDEIVRSASLLAVEFGAHGAKICFGMPKTRDIVQIGTEFVDCEDGDGNRGALETVQLAVSPSLFMIGDGRNDLTTATCLFPGEIYPERAS